MIDTHAHLYLSKRPIPDVLHNAIRAGVTRIILIATDAESAKECQRIVNVHSSDELPLYFTVGLYPGEPESYDIWKVIETLSQDPRCVALGEMGLDYYRVTAPKDFQKDILTRQLDIARSLKLPVVIHNRHSDEDMIEILSNYSDVKKVVHCFSSDTQFVDATLNDSTYYSFTGMITYAKKGKTIASIKHIPLSHIMVETDSPYLSPLPRKGEENEPANVRYIIEHLATIKDLPVDMITSTTIATAMSFFQIP
jgi:TatD DNase family protein